MDVESRIDNAKAKKRLAVLIKKSDRDIFETNELVDKLVGFVVETQSSLIRAHQIIGEQGKAIEALANMISPGGENPFQSLPPAPERPKLVGIEPKIIGIPKGKTN